MASPIDISPVHRKIVCDILRKHLLFSAKVWVFGSRADWTTKNSSDLDLALEGESKMDYKIISALEDGFEESDLPYAVDVVDINAVGSKFKQIIKKQRVPLFKNSQIDVSKEVLTNSSNSINREVMLSDVAELIMGHSPPGSTYNESGVGMIFFQGAKDFNDRHPSPRVFCSAPSRIAQQGDILFSVRAPIGRVNIADRECAVGRGLAIIRCPNTTDARYLEFLLRHMQPLWSMMDKNGTIFGNATKSDLEKLVIQWPDTQDRRAIAHILGTLDDKIELNQLMNETLEEISRALFKSWFVDFEPVRTKMDGRWKRGRSLPGLPAHFYDLFPDTLVDSELDEIPEGWKIKKVSDVTQVVGGSTPSTKIKKYWLEGIYNWVTPKDLAKLQTHVLLNTERKITAEGLHQISSGLLQPGTVLLSSRAPIGYLAIAEIPVAINQGFIAMQPLENISNQFLLYWCKTHRNTIMNHANGSVFLEINKKNFRQIPLIKPNITIMQIFHDIVSLLHKKIVVNEQSTRNIIQLRDILLPRLISGELQVHLPIQGV